MRISIMLLSMAILMGAAFADSSITGFGDSTLGDWSEVSFAPGPVSTAGGVATMNVNSSTGWSDRLQWDQTGTAEDANTLSGDCVVRCTVDFDALTGLSPTPGYLSLAGILTNIGASTARWFAVTKDNGYLGAAAGTWIVVKYGDNWSNPDFATAIPSGTDTVTLRMRLAGGTMHYCVEFDDNGMEEIGTESWSGDKKYVWIQGWVTDNNYGSPHDDGAVVVDDLIVHGENVEDGVVEDKYDELMGAFNYFDMFGPTFSYEDDWDSSDIEDTFELALLAHGLYFSSDVEDTFDDNYDILYLIGLNYGYGAAWAANWATVWASYATFGDEGLACAAYWSGASGLDAYETGEFQPLSPLGDFDYDGLLNEEHYEEESSDELDYSFLASNASHLDPFIDESQDKVGCGKGFPDPYPFEWTPGEFDIFNSTVDLNNSRCFRTATFEEEDLTEFELEWDFGPCEDVGQIWGFRPYKHTDGSYHAYGSVHYGYALCDVVHFVPQEGETWTSQHPIQKWEVESILVSYDGDADYPYDGFGIRDTNNTLYLIINEETEEDHNAVVMRKMTDPDTVDENWTPRILVEPDGYKSEDLPWSLRLTEDTDIYRIGGKYVLCYSVGYFDDHTYKVGLAYSDTLVPAVNEQYSKVLIDDTEDVWDNGETMDGKEVKYLLQSDEVNWPNYVGDHLGINGPGIAGLVDAEDDGPYVIFAGRRPGVENKSGWERYTWKVPVVIDMTATLDKRIEPLLPRDVF